MEYLLFCVLSLSGLVYRFATQVAYPVSDVCRQSTLRALNVRIHPWLRDQRHAAYAGMLRKLQSEMESSFSGTGIFAYGLCMGTNVYVFVFRPVETFSKFMSKKDSHMQFRKTAAQR